MFLTQIEKQEAQKLYDLMLEKEKIMGHTALMGIVARMLAEHAMESEDPEEEFDRVVSVIRKALHLLMDANATACRREGR